MKETLDILYDIFAGAGMLLVLLLIIGFIYGLVVTKRAQVEKAKETRDLLGRLNPELRKAYLEEMVKDVDSLIKKGEEKNDDKQQTKGS